MNLLKISVLSVCLCFFFIDDNFAQQMSAGEATYEFQYNFTKKEMREMKRNFRKQNVEDLLKNTINWQFKLKFKENKGLFYLDTLVNRREESSSILLTGYGYMGAPRHINADKKNIRYHRFVETDDLLLVVNDDLKPAHWNITEETKIINGYKVKKATAYYQVNNAQYPVKNQKITAWFSPKIPVELGPLEFGNLPGLIFEVNFGGGFSYKLTAVKFDNNVEIQEIKGGQEISQEVFEKKYTKVTEVK